MIDSQEITVIIKGLILGKPSDKYKYRWTYRSIESIRKCLPKSKIILSTWEGSDISGLNVDETILNKDPGKLEMWSYDKKKVSHISINNQIITSQKGLEKVNTKYTLIIRGDMLLTGNRFIKYFEKYNKNKSEGYLENKIVVLPTYNIKRILKYKNFFNRFDWIVFDKYYFDICDWVYFGLTKDLENIFSIPLVNKDNLLGQILDGYSLVEENLSPEQYVWVNFLKKYEEIDTSHITYFSEERDNKSEESYAKDTIMISANKFNVKSFKYPASAYGARPWLSRGFYTMSDYNEIHNKYNQYKIFYISNYFEDIFYFLQLYLRFFMRKYGGRVYKFIINIIRRFNGNRDLLK